MTPFPIGQPKVLVVEKDRLLRSLLIYEFRNAGLAVLATHSCGDALAAMDFFHPDVLLTGMRLEDLEGAILIKSAREKQAARTLVIIALSVNDDEETRSRALAAGADDFISKPVNPLAIIAAIQKRICHSALRAGRSKEIYLKGEQ